MLYKIIFQKKLKIKLIELIVSLLKSKLNYYAKR